MKRAAIAIFLLGCAQNGILELQIELPPAPPTAPDDPAWFGSIQVRREGAGFSMPWDGDDPPPLELTDTPQTDCISVNANEDDFDVEVRVRFCRAENCLSLLDGSPPERMFRLGHPIYLGRRTYWFTSIASVPQCELDADCEVGRCLEGICGCMTAADCGAGSSDYTCEDGPDGNPGADSCVRVVDRCDIPGCTTGDPAMFCTLSGQHFCEQSTWADRPGDFMCHEPER